MQKKKNRKLKERLAIIRVVGILLTLVLAILSFATPEGQYIFPGFTVSAGITLGSFLSF